MVTPAAPRTWRRCRPRRSAGRRGRRRRGWSARASRGSARPRPRSSPRAATVRLTPFEGDRALVDDVAQQVGRELDPDAAGEAVLADLDHAAGAVGVALDDVAAEALVGARRQLQVDPGAGAPARRSRSPRSVWFIASVSKPSASASVAVRQTPLTAIESPRPISRPEAGRDPQRAPLGAGLDALHAADVLHQSGEHHHSLNRVRIKVSSPTMSASAERRPAQAPVGYVGQDRRRRAAAGRRRRAPRRSGRRRRRRRPGSRRPPARGW